MKLLSNDCGGLDEARKQFFKDLSTDKDYLEFKENLKLNDSTRSYGSINPMIDCFAKSGDFTEIVRKYLKKQK